MTDGGLAIFLGQYTEVGSGDAIGFWFDQNASVSCTEAAFLAHVPAYILYSNPSIGETRGFECGLQFSGGAAWNTAVSATFPVSATNVGVNTPSTGTYNYIVGFGSPLPTTVNTVVATLDIFYLDFFAFDIDLGGAIQSSSPNGLPVVLRPDFSEMEAQAGSPTATLAQAGGCGAKTASAGSYEGVRNLFK